MFNRRTVLKMGAAGAVAGGLPSSPTDAATRHTLPPDFDRGFDGIYERMPTLDLESQFDFLWGVQNYSLTIQQQAADARADEILAENGLTPTQDVPLDKALALLGPDPIIAAAAITMTASQQIKLARLNHEFTSNADYYLDEMDAAQRKRAGKITLNPDLVIPDYGRHEIHNQPGGYGNPFAGQIYRYGLAALFTGHAYQDENQKRVAATAPTPQDGKVARILELGCALGQMATALKWRFPDAEVWGADSSASMLRYANLRAADLGVDINFKHTLGEELDFPNNHFDLVSVYIVFHEISPDATRKMIKHIARVLRPGGVFYPIDFYTKTGPATDAKGRFAAWLNARWGHEDWREAYAAVDLRGEMEKAGLIVTGGPDVPGEIRNFVGTKPA